MTNFGQELLKRLPNDSKIIDAASGESYRDLADLVPKIGSWLSHGLAPRSPIVMVLDLSAKSALAYLAGLWSNHTVVPTDNLALACELAEQLETDRIWSPKPQQAGGLVLLHGLPGESLEHLVEDPTSTQGGPAALMATSGTSKRPRLVRITHENLIRNTSDIVTSQELSSVDTVMITLPLSYCFGASLLHSHLWAGGSAVVDSRFMFADRVLQAIDSWGCTTFAGVPMTYQMLLKHSSFQTLALPSLRRLLQAGGPLHWEIQGRIASAQPSARFFSMYGQTEATSRITTLHPRDRLTKPGSVGQALAGVTIEIRSPDGQLLNFGESGEIWARGASISPGYWDDAKETADKFQQGWLNTKDVGHLDSDGFLWVTGRSESFLKIRGKRISFTEIDDLVQQAEGVEISAAIGVEHEQAGEALGLFVVKSDSFTEQQVEVNIRNLIPPNWTLHKLSFLDSLPLNGRGKLDRKRLQELLA